MNKQEFQQTIKNMKPPKFFTAITLNEAYEAGFEEAKGNALCNSCFLNEPEKPVVPQFVADWYVDHKAGFELHLSYLCINAQRYPERVDRKVLNWYNNLENEPIRTLVNMHQFGYEVEKEKLYTAKLKLTNEYLCYRPRFNALLHCIVPETTAKEIKVYHFTEDVLVKYHVWGNDTYEVTEVEE